MNDLQYRVKKQYLKVIDLEGTVESYKEDTTKTFINGK